jgi:hypothetical protein
MAVVPGYSGKPRAAKLGIGAAMEVAAIDAPTEYAQWLAPLPPGARIVRRVGASTRLVHLFATDRARLARALKDYRERLAPEVVLWVSWPKKSAGVACDFNEATIRELALPLGWVDVKVCAVSEVWSGLKLVVRKSLR